MGRLQALLRDRPPPRWIYFGRDVEQFYRIRSKFFTDRAICAGELINKKAFEIRDEFMKVDTAMEVDRSNLLYQCADIAEKNPYTSDLFFHCCAYLVFHELLQTGGSLVIIVEDRQLGLHMERHAAAVGYATRRVGPVALLDHLPPFFTSAIRWADLNLRAVYRRFKFVRAFLRNRRLLKKYSGGSARDPYTPLRNLDALLITWGQENMFDTHPRESDRYFGELPRHLRARRYRVAHAAHPYPLTLQELVAPARASGELFVFPDECWGLSDVLKLAWRTLIQKWPIKAKFMLQDLDLTPLLVSEIVAERAKTRQVSAVQWWFVARFLARYGFGPRLVILPFENQPWEKAFRQGAREFLPDTRILGYMHAPYAPLWLPLSMLGRDPGDALIRGPIVAPGAAWARLLATQGFPQEQIRVGPAFRFSYLFAQKESAQRVEGTGDRSGASILVACSHSEKDTLELLHKALEALGASPGMDVVIKFHPDMGEIRGRELLTRALSLLGWDQLPRQFRVIDRPVGELLESAAVLIDMGTSVSLEALALGAHVVHVQPDLWFDMDTLGHFPEANVQARSHQDIRRAVEKLLGEELPLRDLRLRKARALLRDLFAATGAQTISHLLP
ncbi:MAG: hypothetical protein FJ118_20210 [Deltaproteobacteria bacterium]|nr:hypothetical protein [Deltaproteobacteria bacterium]